MTTREMWDKIPVKIVILVVGVVIAFVQVQAQVNTLARESATKSEVAELRAAVGQMANDVRVLRMIACRQARADTFCGTQP